MRKAIYAAAILLACLSPGHARGQEDKKEQQPAAETRPAQIPLRVQVVFAEYDGDKKISSLPYTFAVTADERRARPSTEIRNGLRIPIPTGKDSHDYTYIDIGTNLDCSAQAVDNGQFKLVLSVERSSISESAAAPNATVLRQFKAEVNPILKDGQTYESVVSTDPLNGHVTHLTVTLNVVK